MRILGISQDGHNSSAALIEDGAIVFAACEERFNRQKLTSEFPFGVIKHLQSIGYSVDKIDAVAIGWNSMINAESRRRGFLNRRWKPESLYQVPTKLEMAYGLRNSQWVREEIAYDSTTLNVYYVDHHRSHVASVVYPSGFAASGCAFLTLDANGEQVTSLAGEFVNGEMKIHASSQFPMSPGLVYGAVTLYLGFRLNEDEWKVMALGSTRPPTERAKRFEELFKKILYMREDGQIVVDLKYFEYGLDRYNVYSPYMVETFGPARERSQSAPIEDHHIDVAYAVQAAFEKLLLDLGAWLKAKTNQSKIVLAGGCMMNCVANGKFEQSGLFEQMYVGGWPGDEGTAIGAAYLCATEILGEKWSSEKVLTTAVGRSYTDEEIEEVLKKTSWLNSSSTVKYSPDKLNRAVAGMLAGGAVIGWFQGKEEFGQRALGHRSILADPRSLKMKDRVNAKVKYREGFRPFAPSVLADKATEWFDMGRISEVTMMEKVVSVRPDRVSEIPAVTHNDGTARVHTVMKSVNEPFYSLIEAFCKITGVPVLLNTSFNVAGEPIVSTPEEALRTFAGSGLDVLVIGSYVVSK